MPLSPEEVKQWVTHNGFDPEEYDADPYTTKIKPRVKAQPTMSPTTAKPEGAWSAGLRTAALGVLPNAAAFAPALAAGKAVGAATAPFMGPWAAIPAIGAGLVVGAGVGTAASAVQDAALSQFEGGRKFLDTTAKAAEEHPSAAVVGNVASTLPTMKVNPKMLKDAAHVLNEIRGGAGVMNKLATSEAAQNVLISGGIGGAMSVGEDLQADKPVDVPKALLNTVLQGAVSDAHGGVLGNVPGIGPLLKSAAYKGQPHGVLNDAQLRNVATETTTPGVVDPELAAKRQAKLEQMALDKKALEELNMFAEQGHITLDKFETAQKLVNLEKRRKALQATIDKPPEPEVTTVQTAGDPLKQWGRDKAAQQGVSKIEFEDTGMLTPGMGKAYGSFTPDEIRASTFAGQKGPKDAKPVTTLPEYNQTEAAFFGRSKDLQTTGDPANPPAAPEPALVASTIIHEPYHAAFDNMIRSESSSQTKMWDKLTAAVERDARFKQWQDGKFTSQPTVEEYLVRSGTRDFLADPQHKNRSWVEERRSLKRLNDGTANADDAVRIAGMKFRYDSQLVAPRVVKPPVDSRAVTGVEDSEQRLSEPSADTTPANTAERQARVQSYIDAKKAEPNYSSAMNRTKGWNPDITTWRKAAVADFLGVSEPTYNGMVKQWEKDGVRLADGIFNYGRTKTVSKVDEAGMSTPEPKLDGKHFEQVRQEFIQDFRASNPEDSANPIASGIAAEKAFDKHLEDFVYEALRQRPAAVQKGFLSTDRLTEEGPRKADAFVELVGEVRRQVMNSRVQLDSVNKKTGEVIDGFKREVVNAADRAIKAKIAQSKGVAKVREAVKRAAEKDSSVEGYRIDRTFDPEDARKEVGIVEDQPFGEELAEPKVEDALPEPIDTEGKDPALMRRDYKPKYARGVESEKLSPAQAETLNRTLADRMEAASQELDSLNGKAFETALAKHTKELQTLLYSDPKRAEEIITLVKREDPETVKVVADRFRSGKVKLSEPSATPSPATPYSPDKSKQGWVERLSPQFDQVRKFSPAVADAMANAESKRGEYEGQFLWSKVHKMQETFPDATVEDNIAALDYARAQFRKEPLPYVTAEQEAMAKLWNDEVAGPVRDEQIAQGMPIETESGNRRTAKRSPWYAADMLSKEALALFTKSTETAKVEAAKNTWAKYVVDASESRGTPVTLKEAKAEINAFVDALGSGSQDASEFGALRKAQGYGLPAELRERNLTHMMHRYSRRVSRDLANFVYLEKDPVVGALLGKDNPITGARYPEPAGGRLNAHEEVTDAMSFLNNTFKVAHQPRMLGFTRLVNNLIMGPMSGVRDTATVVVNALPYVDSVDGAFDIFRGLIRARHEVQSSLEAGARTGRHRFDQFDTLESVDTVANIFNKAAEFMRKYSGRDIIEQGNRIWVFAAGKQLAERAILENNARFLDKFGAIAKTVAKDGTVTWDTSKLAKAFVDRNQGTYGGRGLPASTVEGMAAPWFSLARWSIEKANVIYQDVVKPAYVPGKDGKRNFGPLLTYTLGAYLTGEAIEELTEVLNNDKKLAIPKWEELDAADASADRYVARLVNVMQLGSFGGMAGDLLKMSSDVAQGDKPRGFTVPAAELIGDGIAGSTVNFFRAVRDGSDPIDAAGILIQEFLKNQVQVARIANNWSDSDNVERKNRFRDLRVWKQMTGREVPSGFNETNPAVRPLERQLKRATTPEEVEELLPKILDDLQEKHKDNPWGLKKAIDRLKSNSYQTFPSPTSDTPDAMEYYQFLVRSVGKEEADARLEDYMQQSGFNRGKSSMLRSGR